MKECLLKQPVPSNDCLCHKCNCSVDPLWWEGEGPTRWIMMADGSCLHVANLIDTDNVNYLTAEMCREDKRNKLKLCTQNPTSNP